MAKGRAQTTPNKQTLTLQSLFTLATALRPKPTRTTMALRRLAQENNVATNSPKARNGEQDSLGLPFASRSLRYRSPASNASLSATIPFDWEAARAQRPPPLSTPSKSRKSLVNGANVNSPIRRAVIRKKNILEKYVVSFHLHTNMLKTDFCRIVSVPSWVAFQFALFPNNLPLPSHNTSAWVLGGFLHVVSLSARVCQLRQVPDSDLGWEDLYREREDEAWFDWVRPTNISLLHSLTPRRRHGRRCFLFS